jgi:XTP/dITP diphosphohydrolase
MTKDICAGNAETTVPRAVINDSFPFQEIILASNNAGKLREFSALFAPLGLKLLPQSAFDVSEAEEPYATFLENALAKARHASAVTGMPALADDSGLCVNALNGAPGVLSARYAGEPRSDRRNNALLVETMAQHNNKAAYYYCVLVLVRHADDPQPIIADGRWDGEVLSLPQGHGGFGYDAHFWLPLLQTTAAALSPDEKNRYSHRGMALREMVEKLQ